MSFRVSLAWMTVSQGALFVLQFIVSVIIARLLGPYEMGIFAVAMSVLGMLSIIRSVGLGSYLVRAPELTKPLLATVFTINALLAVLVAVGVFGLGLLGAALLQEPGVRRLLLVLTVVPLLGIFDLVPAAGIERRGDFRSIAIINVIRFGSGSAATLAFAYFGSGYMSPGYGHIISAILATILNNIFGRRLVAVRFGLEQWREITRFGLQMLSISALFGLQGRIADLLMARLLGLSALGVFSRANSLTGVLWENVQTIVLRVFFVKFSAQRRQGLPVGESYLRLIGSLTGLLWPAFVGMAVVAGPLVEALYGDQWISAALPLSLLAVSSVAFVPLMAGSDVFIVSGQTGLQTRIELARAPLSLALFSAGCLISLPVAAGMKIVEASVTLWMYHSHLARMTGTRWSDFIPVYRNGILLAITAATPVTIVMLSYGWSPHTPLNLIITACVAGVLGWAAALRMFRHPLWDEVQGVITSLMSRWLPKPQSFPTREPPPSERSGGS